PAAEAAVWAEVCLLLQDPRRIEQEYTCRWEAVQGATTPGANSANRAHLSKLHQGLARLIDSYTEGFITKDEFTPRVSRLRQRITHFEEALEREREEASTLHELRLLMGQVEAFATQVRDGLADANWQVRRDIIRALVKRIEVTDEHLPIAFRVGAQAPGPPPPSTSWPHWLPRLLRHAAQAGRSAPSCPAHSLYRPATLPRLGLSCPRD